MAYHAIIDILKSNFDKTSKVKIQSGLILEIGIWDLFGIWCLSFGIYRTIGRRILYEIY